MSHIEGVAVGQDNTVSSNAPAIFVGGIGTVVVVAEVLIFKAEQAACKIDAAGTTVDSDSAPILTAEDLVNIDVQVQRGNFVSTIAVCVIGVVAQAVFCQIDGGQFLQRDCGIGQSITILARNKLTIMADGDVDFFSLRRKYGGGHKAQHHYQSEEQAEELFHSHIGFILSLMFLLSFSSLSAFSSLPPPVPAAKGRDRP